MKVYFVLFLVTVVAFPAAAHPGKTDYVGGHRCLKECAEWDLYYNEYHLHDKNGKTVKVAGKKPGRSKSASDRAEEKAAVGEGPADRSVEKATARPAAAAMAVEPDLPALPGILLLLFLLLFLVVRRNRRKTAGGESGRDT
jgi:hypothetical protein